LNDIAILQVLDFVTNLQSLLASGEKSEESWIKAKHRKNIAKQKIYDQATQSIFKFMT
jgi:hypothetical protein